MFRTMLAALAVAVFLGACASKEPARTAEIDVTAGKTRVFLPAFLVLESGDLKILRETKRAKGLKLSGGRTADCTPKGCLLTDGRGSRFPITNRDVATFTGLMQAAAKTGKEASKTDGPVTVRCGTDRCTADLLIESAGPVKMQGKVNVEAEPEVDFAASLLQGFVRGLLGGK